MFAVTQHANPHKVCKVGNDLQNELDKPHKPNNPQPLKSRFIPAHGKSRKKYTHNNKNAL